MLCLTAPEGRAAPRVARAANTALAAAPSYARHVPERALLYALVQAHYPDFIVRLEAEDRPLPEYVREEFETYLRCGVLEHGFLRVVCEQCRAERLVAYSCKKRGFCPSCGARRMAESARHLVEEVFGPRPVRQWVLSFLRRHAVVGQQIVITTAGPPRDGLGKGRLSGQVCPERRSAPPGRGDSLSRWRC